MRAHPILAALVLFGGSVAGGQAPPRDTLRLATLHESAIRGDPRGGQLELLSAQSGLRQRNIAAERLPMLSAEAQAQYQSDVPRIPIVLPGGVAPPAPPNDTYDARLAANQRLYDATLGARRALEGAQLAQAQSRLRVSLYQLRQQVNDAFFDVLRVQVQIDELEVAITDLEAQLRVAANRVREGSALPSEANTIRAELLRRRQMRDEGQITRLAALRVLADLTGIPADSGHALELPDMSVELMRARGAVGYQRARPEYEQFARSREALDRQAEARAAQDKPRLSAFGRVGYGRPGLNPLNDTFDTYWLAGVQVQWAPWTWGTARRDREVLALQRQIVSSDEEAFTEQLRRSVTRELAAVDRLEVALAADEEIITLREGIVAETRLRFVEGAVTSAEYVNRQTDVLAARISHALHRVELAQARARLLTTLGIEVR